MGKSREGLLLRAREMAEVLLGLSVAFGLSWWMPEVWRPSHLVFGAFFVVIFAIAIRYHTLVAYSASVLAALSYGLLLWLHPETRVRPDLFSLALEPFLLLISGIVASDLLRGQRHRLALFEQKYTHIEETSQTIQRLYQETLKVNATLEQQVAGLPTSLATMSEKLAQVWKLEAAERFAATLDLIACAIEAQSCALYTQKSGSWQLCADYSMESVAHAAVLDTDNSLLTRVIEQCRVSTVRDALAEEESVSPDVAVMAGPLLDQQGKIIGIVVIDTLPLLKFTPSTIRLFSSLLGILSLALYTTGSVACEDSGVSSQAVPDPDTTDPALPKLKHVALTLS